MFPESTMLESKYRPILNMLRVLQHQIFSQDVILYTRNVCTHLTVMRTRLCRQ